MLSWQLCGKTGLCNCFNTRKEPIKAGLMPTSAPLRTSCERPPNCYGATVKCELGWPGLVKGKFPATLPGLTVEKEGLEGKVG